MFFKKARNIPIVLTNKVDIQRLINSSDLFLITPSTVVLDDILLKTPTIVLDYYYDPVYYLHNDPNVIKSAHNQRELREYVIDFLNNDQLRKDYIDSIFKYSLLFTKGFHEKDHKENFKFLEIIRKMIEKK